MTESKAHYVPAALPSEDQAFQEPLDAASEKQFKGMVQDLDALRKKRAVPKEKGKE